MSYKRPKMGNLDAFALHRILTLKPKLYGKAPGTRSCHLVGIMNKANSLGAACRSGRRRFDA
jgi:hypothetical protein